MQGLRHRRQTAAPRGASPTVGAPLDVALIRVPQSGAAPVRIVVEPGRVVAAHAAHSLAELAVARTQARGTCRASSGCCQPPRTTLPRSPHTHGACGTWPRRRLADRATRGCGAPRSAPRTPSHPGRCRRSRHRSRCRSAAAASIFGRSQTGASGALPSVPLAAAETESS